MGCHGACYAVRTELMGAVIVGLTGITAWAQGQIGGSYVGLVIIWSMHFTISLGFITLSWADVDSKIVCAERIQVRPILWPYSRSFRL